MYAGAFAGVGQNLSKFVSSVSSEGIELKSDESPFVWIPPDISYDAFKL